MKLIAKNLLHTKRARKLARSFSIKVPLVISDLFHQVFCFYIPTNCRARFTSSKVSEGDFIEFTDNFATDETFPKDSSKAHKILQRQINRVEQSKLFRHGWASRPATSEGANLCWNS